MSGEQEDFWKGKPDPIREALKQLASEDNEKITRQCAKFYWISFQQLMAEGFNVDQALQIAIKRGPFLT